MTIKLRFTLLLGLMLAGFGVALALFVRFEGKASADLLRVDRQGRAQLLEHWIDATYRVLPQLASDLTQASEVRALVAYAGTDSARETVAAILRNHGVASLWTVSSAGRVVQHVSTAADTPGDLPLSPADFLALVGQTPAPRFFAERGADLLEVCVRRIAPAQRDVEWIVLARAWDEAQLRSLTQLTEGRVTLQRTPRPAMLAPSTTVAEIVRPMLDWQGHRLATLHVAIETPELAITQEGGPRQALFFFGFGLLLVAGLWLAVWRWTLRPLRAVAESLRQQAATEPVAALSGERNELGQVATLLVSSFEQRRELEKEIKARTRAQEELARSEAELRRTLDERARLGRDLHDGIIQSLYAAGMGLAGIRMQLQPEQVEAATRLEQTRAALNETIHDVRNFIVGLEPESLRLNTFSQAVGSLLDTMRGMRTFRAELQIDDALAARLTLSQRVHALQIAREAVSNALRHGQANEISVALAAQGDMVEFSVVDNGRGFDPSEAPAGHGLANFVERARELDAELSVDSRPQQGTTVRLIFSHLHQ